MDDIVVAIVLVECGRTGDRQTAPAESHPRAKKEVDDGDAQNRYSSHCSLDRAAYLLYCMTVVIAASIAAAVVVTMPKNYTSMKYSFGITTRCFG
jgi:hypothetical protein